MLERALVVSFLLADLSVRLGSQTTAGATVGRVTDQTLGALPGVGITAVNEATNARWTTTTDNSGNYQIPLLPPGVYRLEAELAGFRKLVRTGIRLQVAQRARVDLTLELGVQTEEITVHADVSPIQSESAASSTVIDYQKAVELPLNGRDFFQLIALAPGSAPAAEGVISLAYGGAVNLNGARAQSNTSLLDGLDNNDQGLNLVIIPVSADAVEELKVQASTYTAEFGRTGGAQFNYVTRSGSNLFHISIYEFLRNAVLDARNYFDHPRRPNPQFQRNQFGATVGGFLRRDRAFFFAAYEGMREREALTRVATVPPTTWVRGDFSSLLTGQVDPRTGLDSGQLVDPRTGLPIPGNFMPPAQQDPAGAAIAQFYPPPNDPSETGPAPATVTPLGRTTTDQFHLRLDQQVPASHRLFYRYSIWSEGRFNPYDLILDLTNVPGFGNFNRSRNHSLAIGWTTPLTPSAINDYRFGLNRARVGLFQEHQGEDVSQKLGILGLSTNPRDVGRPGVILGVTDPLTEPWNNPVEERLLTLQFLDTLTWVHGRHSLKVGADVRYVRFPFFLNTVSRGVFTFAGLSGNPVADLLLGTVAAATRRNPQFTSDINLRTGSLNFFLHDDWKLTSHLTFHLGLRYEYNRPPADTEDRLAVADLTNPGGGFIRVGERGIPRAVIEPDRNNVAPRVGFAWRPLRSTRTVLRGGYGIFYDAAVLNANILPRYVPPFYSLDLVLGPRPLRDAFSGHVLPVSHGLGLDRNFRDAYYQHWNLSLQRELRNNLTLEVAYVGSKGTKLLRVLDHNQGPAGGPPVRNPAFGPAQLASSSASSHFHSLQLRLEQRFAGGWSLLSSYTWSRSMDDASSLAGSKAGGIPSAPQNSFDTRAERGPSDFDTPHRYVISYVWELPFGAGKRWLGQGGALAAMLGNWELAGITTLQSGQPFTVYYGAAANYSGSSNGANGGPGFDRPNLVGNPKLADPDPARWFNTAAFAPPHRTFGNVGRNTLRADGRSQFDIALHKNLTLGEKVRLQFRTEVFNAFNTPNFFLPINDLTNASAGRAVRAYHSRQIQFGLRLGF